LAKLSKFHPLLLVFDDIHWADDSSIELLTYAARHLQGQRVLLIATCRDGELAPQHKLRSLTTELQREKAITMISAHPLTQSQIGTLVSHLPAKLISSIQTQCSGNPLFAEELARFVYSGEQGQLNTVFFTTKTEWENAPSSLGAGSAQGTGQGQALSAPTVSALPDAITAVLERRLHLLSSGCRTLLSKAAVLGDPFELEQLQQIAPEHNEDAILDFLEEALHAGILTEEEKRTHVSYHFWHPLIMNYLYSHISAARRAQLHRRVAALSTTSKSDTPERFGN
jgi:predicted ATPase